nr:hypothetical protein GCM10025732_00760 [Glycomyces mayteni]
MAGTERAERHFMIPAFDGIDKWVPIGARQPLVKLVDQGAVRVTKAELPESAPSDPLVQRHVRRRWSPDSPLLRCSNAALGYLESRGVDLRQVHLHGVDIGSRTTPYYVSIGYRYFKSLSHCLKEYEGVQWIEVVRPTRRSPMFALVIDLLDRDRIEDL